jgi:hypothetical protein
LREDAGHLVGDDLNLWPQIRARIIEEEQEIARARGSVSARVEREETLARRGERPGDARRERSRHLNLTRMLPSALMAVCMMLFVVTAHLLSNSSAVPRNRSVDACDLITQGEVEGLTDTTMEQFRWQPNMPELVACAYFGKGEMVNVMVGNFKDEQAAERYLKSIRPDLLTGLEAQETPNSAYSVASLGGGRRIDISGDDGYFASRAPGNMKINFWDVLVRQQNRYFIVTWMTGADRPDPTIEMEDLARLVSARLPAR